MMKLDHIVVFVADLNEASRFFQEKGFHVVPGGSHPMWGTYNVLIYFEACYIELIAIEHESKFKQAAKQPYTLHETYALNQRQNGLTRIACRTQHDTMLAEMLQGDGFDVHGPERFSRNTPNGEQIFWHLVHVGNSKNRSLPFFINWGMSDENRTMQLKEKGLLKQHRNATVDVAELTLGTTDLESTAHFYESCHLPITRLKDSIEVMIDQKKIVYFENLDDMKIVFTSEDTFQPFMFENMRMEGIQVK
jgi:hypothetical protein